MASKKRKGGSAGAGTDRRAGRRKPRPNRTASVHVTLTPEHELRLRGLAVLLGTDPSEAVMDLVEGATAGMHFYIPNGPGLALKPPSEAAGAGDEAA